MSIDLNCGFFNSVDGDRKYNADDMTRPYHRIISDGVFSNPNGTESTDFKVSVSSDDATKIIVQAGEGIFADKWTELLANQEITVVGDNGEHKADIYFSRIDSIVIRIDKGANARKGTLEYIEGEAGSEPTAPAMTRNGTVTEYRIANITIPPRATTLTASNIEDTRGGTDCGYATHLLQSRALIRSYRSTYITSTQDETTIPINIPQYAKGTDILQVYINGLMLIEETEYTISGYNVILTKPVDKSTPIYFVVYKSVDATNAESVIGEVEKLQSLQLTANNGSSKIRIGSGQDVLATFKDLDAGMYTLYCPSDAVNLPSSGAFRILGHLTSGTSGTEIGWVMAFKADGSVYANYLNGGSWVGWKVLYETTNGALWTGASFMGETATITPSKKLSECEHGWVLVWCDYADSTSTKNNYEAVTFCIPKLNANGTKWSGSSFLCFLPIQVDENGTFKTTCKKIYVKDNELTGFAGNNTGDDNRDVVLGAIYEY